MKKDNLIKEQTAVNKAKDKIAQQAELDNYINELNREGILVNADDIPRYTREWKRNHSVGRKQRKSPSKAVKNKFDVPYPPKVYTEPIPIDWKGRIDKLEQYFSITVFPTGSVQLNPWTTITDVPGYVAAEMTFVKICNKNPVYLPYLERLESLVNIFKNRDLELVSNILDIDSCKLNLNGINKN